MKKLALLLSLVILPLSTGFAFDLFEDDGLRTIDSYQLTHRNSYEKIRSEDQKATEFVNEGKNKLYEKNVNDGLEDAKRPGIIFGKDCINWKSCLRGAFWKTNGYNRSYAKKKITKFSVNGHYGWIGNGNGRTLLRNRLHTEISGKEKLMKMRQLSASKADQSDRRNN